MNERYALRVITAPPYEPISVEEAKKFLRIDADDIDQEDEIAAMIIAAREWIEGYTGLALIQQTLEMSIDRYPWRGVIELPRAPVLWIDSVSYIDNAGVLQQWGTSNYQTDIVSVPGRIALAYGGLLPSSYRGDMNSWRVRFTAGHDPAGSPNDADSYRENVPGLAKLAMKVHITGAYEGTLDAMMKTAENLAHPLRQSFL